MLCLGSREYFRLRLELEEGLFIMSRDDLALRNPLEVLEALSAPKPRRVVSSQPTLRYTVAPLLETSARWKTGRCTRVTYVLNHMAVVTDEKESSSLRHVDLHSNQAVGMPR